MGKIMSAGERWETLFNSGSFATAALAAYLWFRASQIELPSHTGDNLARLDRALKKQSRMNARAALAASIAATFQGLSLAAKLLAPGLP
jgi:hypothetical protein